MNSRSAVFLDGGYLDKVLLIDFNKAKINYEKLAAEMAGQNELLRAYYYHCLPYQGSPPTEVERARFASMSKFVNTISRLPRFEVRLGRLAFRGTQPNGSPIFMQKRVDCMLGVDMALLAAKGKVSNIEVLSGDSDFIPAIEAVKREGILVTLWHGNVSGGSTTQPSRDLYQTCDDRKPLTQEIVDRILR
jgi:uncharacterized LabA/DUF88 family protein